MTWDSTKDAANDSRLWLGAILMPFVGAAGEQFMTHFTIANRWGWDDSYVLDATIYTNMFRHQGGSEQSALPWWQLWQS